MCSINCSGGCIECAPDEHAFDEWEDREVQYSNDAKHDVRRAFMAGWYAAKHPETYKCFMEEFK